jgi:PEP-CTERM motif
MKLFLLAGVSALALTGTSADAMQMFEDTTPGSTTFTAATSGTYQIDVYGAQGGGVTLQFGRAPPITTSSGGYGIGVGNDFTLKAGEVLAVQVGAQGQVAAQINAIGDFVGAGGGGGSFVQGSGLLIVAGGGGGGSAYNGGGNASALAGNGSGGRGGGGVYGKVGGAGGGGGGGGFSGAGAKGGPGENTDFGYAPRFPTYAGGGGGGAFPSLGGGGGGGGSGGYGSYYGGGGGGGGFTGGSGGKAGSGDGGGGGGSSGGASLGFQYGNGQVIIDQLTQTSGVPEPATWSLMTSGVGLLGWMLRRRRFPRTV